MRQLESTDTMTGTTEIVKKIRQIRIDMDIISLLIACVEDVPQALIVVIVIHSNTKWNAISVLNFSLAIISFSWKLLQVLAGMFVYPTHKLFIWYGSIYSAKFGCKDPANLEEHIEMQETQQIMKETNQNEEA